MIKGRILEIIDELANNKPTKFAKKAGIPPSTFSGYLSGRIPHADHLVRIRETYGISIDWLLTGQGDKFINRKENKNGKTDSDILLGDIQEWLTEQKATEKSIWSWFRIQFGKSFPDFIDWQKKRNETNADRSNRRAA